MLESYHKDKLYFILNNLITKEEETLHKGSEIICVLEENYRKKPLPEILSKEDVVTLIKEICEEVIQKTEEKLLKKQITELVKAIKEAVKLDKITDENLEIKKNNILLERKMNEEEFVKANEKFIENNVKEITEEKIGTLKQKIQMFSLSKRKIEFTEKEIEKFAHIEDVEALVKKNIIEIIKHNKIYVLITNIKQLYEKMQNNSLNNWIEKNIEDNIKEYSGHVSELTQKINKHINEHLIDIGYEGHEGHEDILFLKSISGIINDYCKIQSDETQKDTKEKFKKQIEEKLKILKEKDLASLKQTLEDVSGILDDKKNLSDTFQYKIEGFITRNTSDKLRPILYDIREYRNSKTLRSTEKLKNIIKEKLEELKKEPPSQLLDASISRSEVNMDCSL